MMSKTFGSFFTGCLLASVVALPVAASSRGPTTEGEPARPLILVHYMPWFAAPPTSPDWGWHWTMNAYDPDGKGGNGRKPGIAAHYTPLIGPYDSGDPAAIEYHLLLMKLAGIDGLIVDWYGLSDLFDYPVMHRNTAALFPVAARLGLKVAICYEDQTIPRLVEAGKLAAGDRVAHAHEVLSWLETHWFAEPAYLELDGRPVLLSFGFDGLTDEEWERALPKGAGAPVYLSEHRRRGAAAGAFDWPIPKEGLAPLDRFAGASKGWPVAMPAAFPRFHDIYKEAGVQDSYGRIPDDDGRTFRLTLRRALESKAPFVQVVTWNDWGEGTMVEPSKEFGFRDLETIQGLRRERVDPKFVGRADALRLVPRLYALRRRADPNVAANTLDAIARDLATGKTAEARAALERIEAKGRD